MSYCFVLQIDHHYFSFTSRKIPALEKEKKKKNCLSVMFLDHATHFLLYTIHLIAEGKKNQELLAMITKVSFRGIRLLIHPLSLLSLVVAVFFLLSITNG